ncbi:transketolase [Elioraea rosea]|uniref:transketolase n=1 Tax=Elioraea rosea TaxID=2492390 RepID=UPI00118561CD|nr:transketolase [Elioraea rosea]
MAEILERTAGPERRMADALRALAIDAVEAAKSGHPGMPMGMADVATALWTRVLKFDAADPRWPDRDRFVLSAGHGSMLLYGLLHLTGHAGMEMEELRNFRQLGSRTAGHPEHGEHPGIETTTGPLGQGLATAVGMAMAERMLAARFGRSLVDHRTWVIASDGDLMEGISHEAASLAGHLKLSKLTVLFDDNAISIDGSTDLSCSDDVLKRFAAYGWATKRIDGHDHAEIAGALGYAMRSGKPTLIACRTIIGFGAPKKAGTAGSHGAPLGPEEAAAAKAALGWDAPAFTVPSEIAQAWGEAGRRGARDRMAWLRRIQKSPQRAEFERVTQGRLPDDWRNGLDAWKQTLSTEKPKIATRQASQKALEALVPAIPELVGGSADLTGSNLTHVKAMGTLSPDNWGGRHIHFGVREHAMGAAMNGMALHGGLVPFGGTFLVFSDYMRPAIRLAALMRQRAVYVFTHDSIGLGEDGPTHQPVEHLAALRAIPNLHVFRPADAVETAEAWALALARQDGPSALALTRQALPTLRTTHTPENMTARGGYVLVEASGPRKATLIASGSEVSLAVAARELLEAEGIATAVVSMPCFELFFQQDEATQAITLGGGLRVGIEAAIGFGWDRVLGLSGLFIGMSGFGASGPYEKLYKHFGITAEAVAQAVQRRLG